MKRSRCFVKNIIKNTLLSLLIIASFFVVSSPARAATSSTTVTSYGQYYYESGYDNTNSIYQLTGGNPLFLNKGAVSYVFFRYNFKNTYDGYVNLTVNANSSFAWQNVHFVVDGGVFTQQPNMSNVSTSKSFQISFQNSDGFTLSIVSDNKDTFSTTSSITVGSSNFNLVPDVADDLHYLRGRWDYYVPGMSTSLANISTNSSTMQSDIAILKSYASQIEGYVDNIEPLLNSLIEYNKIRDSVDIPIYSRFAYINLLRYGEISDQYNYPYSTAQYGFFPTILTSKYSEPAYNSDFDIFIPAGKTLHFIYTISYWANIFDFIDSNSNSLNPNVIMIEGNNYYRSYDVSYTNSGSSNIFINVAMIRNVNRPVIPLYLGVNVPSDVAMLFDMDFENTYTRLLQQIATGIGNISQQQIIENNTNITNHNNYQQQINNVENNYYQQFNNHESTIENNNTFDFTGLSNDGVQVYNDIFSNVYGISLVKWPILITLLGLVIVIILG